MTKNPYRLAYTAEEVEEFDIDPDSIRAGFRGVPHWPPLTPEQEADLAYRFALTMYAGIMKLELQETPLITDPDLLKKYTDRGLDVELIQNAIYQARTDLI